MFKYILLAIGMVLAISGCATFQEGPADENGADSEKQGVVFDSSGKVVRDRFGECVWNPYFEGMVAECHPEPEPVVKPKPEPKPAPAPQPTYEPAVLSDRVHFDFDKSYLRADALATLEDLRLRLGEAREIKSIEITGHADHIGTVEYNQGLSERRAASVRDYLVEHGVDADIITTEGKSELEPIATNDTAEGRQKNRRAEIRIKGVVKEEYLELDADEKPAPWVSE